MNIPNASVCSTTMPPITCCPRLPGTSEYVYDHVDLGGMVTLAMLLPYTTEQSSGIRASNCA